MKKLRHNLSIGLAQKFVQLFCNTLWKNLNFLAKPIPLPNLQLELELRQPTLLKTTQNWMSNPSVPTPPPQKAESIHKCGPFFFFFFRPFCTAHGILVPQPGIEPAPPAVEVQSLNHWTTSEVSGPYFLNFGVFWT